MRLQNRDRKQKLHFARGSNAALPCGEGRAIHTALSQSRAKRASKNGASVIFVSAHENGPAYANANGSIG